jgi:arylsulfatase A-like enzyme
MNLDVLPTAIVAAGGKPEASWQLDGVDLMPYLTGAETGRPHPTLYWRFGPQWAIRDGDMKLVVSNGGSGRPELYNLATDIGESKNLAASQPEKVKELQAMFNKWNAEQAPPSARDAVRGKGAGKKGKKKTKKAGQ